MVVELVEIKDYEQLVTNLLKTDNDFVDVFKIHPSEEAYIKANLDRINEDKCNVYAIIEGGEEIGVVAKTTVSDINYIYLFFIHPVFRKECAHKSWDKVVESFNDEPFICGMLKKNIRACKFFDKKCSEYIDGYSDEMKENVRIYMFKRE